MGENDNESSGMGANASGHRGRPRASFSHRPLQFFQLYAVAGLCKEKITDNKRS